MTTKIALMYDTPRDPDAFEANYKEQMELAASAFRPPARRDAPDLADGAGQSRTGLPARRAVLRGPPGCSGRGWRPRTPGRSPSSVFALGAVLATSSPPKGIEPHRIPRNAATSRGSPAPSCPR